ncbi:MAG: cytochrome P460 family protein, partial [Polyangiaceae bacterium]
VYVTTSSQATVTTAAGQFPVGTRFVEAHFEKASSALPVDEAAGPLFMMEKMAPGFDKDHGDWRFVAVSSIGELVEQGKIESCVGCHDDAPHDHTFAIE